MADEPLEICPFDRNHQILRARLPQHITKCARNHPDIKLKYCPYDGRHRLNPKEYDSHVKSCPAKEFSFQNTEAQAVNSTFETPGIIPIQRFMAQDEPVEAWDVDEASPSPLKGAQANVETQQFPAPKIGFSRKQRWEHRYMQRRVVQGEASGHNQTEQREQESDRIFQDDSSESLSSSNEQDSFDDSAEWSAMAQSLQNMFSPVKPEPEVLDISGLKIDNQNNTTATERQNTDAIPDSKPKARPFSYAAALGSKKEPFKKL